MRSLHLVIGAYGHGVQTLEVIVYRFVHNAAGGKVGAGFLQSNFQLALPQALVSVGFHHHKPQFAPHAQSHLPFVLQRP